MPAADPVSTGMPPGGFRDFVDKSEEMSRPAEQRFADLAALWKTETRFVSNVATKLMHIAYQKIIGMRPPVVPLILQDLIDNGPNDWFWALHVITDANHRSRPRYIPVDLDRPHVHHGLSPYTPPEQVRGSSPITFRSRAGRPEIRRAHRRPPGRPVRPPQPARAALR
jgi:hypothetical protein